jgi:hypothetical protein
VHGRSARSRPAAKTRGRSGFATSGRAIVTASHCPSSIAFRITDAVWNPPVTSTGIETARLIAAASPRFAPSTWSTGLDHRRCISRLIGQSL